MSESSFPEIKTKAAEILSAAADSTRYLVAVAGPPASGKSTLASHLAAEINAQAGSEISTVVPMDGFHLDNATLEKMNLLPRKGAPQTFDSEGFVRLVKQLAQTDQDTPVPLFDRQLDAVVPDAQLVKAEQRILLLEGNYLLLEELPWCELHDLYDAVIFLNPGLDVLEKRLIGRWLEHGLDEAAARQRAESNDLPNARYVVKHSVQVS
ncbi:MAG: phosphoribulokinase [Thiolinea sp.]